MEVSGKGCLSGKTVDKMQGYAIEQKIQNINNGIEETWSNPGSEKIATKIFKRGSGYLVLQSYEKIIHSN
jgi:hypothetical protein